MRNTNFDSLPMKCGLLAYSVRRVSLAAIFVFASMIRLWAAYWPATICRYPYSLEDRGSIFAPAVKSGSVELVGRSSKTSVHDGNGTIHRYTIVVPEGKVAIVEVKWTGASRLSGTWPMRNVLMIGKMGIVDCHTSKTFTFEKNTDVDIYADAMPMNSADKLWYLSFNCVYYYDVIVEYSDKAKPIPTPTPTDEVNVTFEVNIPNNPHDEDYFCLGNTYYERRTIIMKCGQKLLPNAPECRRNGYKLLGWYDAGGNKISESYKVPKSPLTLYAHWSKKTELKVTFDSNGGYGSLGTQVFYPAEAQDLGRNLGFVKKDGCVFKGWSKQKTGGVQYADGASFSTTVDTTLFAVWERSGITVTFDEGGYVGEGSIGLYTSGEQYGTLPTPEPREGYDFVGWYDTYGHQVTVNSIVPNYDIKLVAKWNLSERDWVSPVSYSGMSRFDVPGDESDCYLRSCELPMIISGVFSSETTVYRNDCYTNQSLYSIIFEPTTSGYYPVYFNSEVDVGNEYERRALSIELSDGNESLGALESSGTFLAYLCAGEQYVFYFKLSGDCAARSSGDSSFNIQIGGVEPQILYIGCPDAPVAIVEDDGVRLSWNAVQGAAKYYVYRKRQGVYTGKTGLSPYAGYEFIGAVSGATSYFDRLLPHGFATDYYILAGKDGAISGASGRSSLITVEPHFSASVSEVEFPWNASEGYVTIRSDAYWMSFVKWIGYEDDEPGIDFGFINSARGDLMVPIRFCGDNTSGRDRVWRVDFSVTGIENVDSLTIIQKARGNDTQVTFSEKAGSAAQTSTYTEDEPFRGLPTPERDGYVFLGWTATEDGDDFITEVTYVDSETSQLFAQWMPNSYTVRFNANGGSGTMSNTVVMCNFAWPIPLCQFEKSGCVFLGWAMSPDGNVVYCDGDMGDNLTLDDGSIVDLYAVWGDEAGFYGPWGYEPEIVKDDVAVSTLSSISLTINDVGMAAGDIVAAYDSNRSLRAIGKVALVNGKLGASLSMNVAAGTRLMFLLWKNGTPIYDICVADAWIVAPTPGTVDDTFLNLSGTPDTKIPFPSCEIALSKSGWHLVSFNVLPDDASPANVFAKVADKIDQVVQGSRTWKPTTGGRLTELQIGVGYWVRTSTDNVSWSIDGASDQNVEVLLSKGWNLVGYPLLESGNPAVVLKSAFDSKKISQIVDGSKVYPGRLGALEPGKGYWLYAPAACTITFDQN